MASMHDHRFLAMAAGVLITVVVLVRPGTPYLGGVDAACYARIAQELAQRPIADWASITLDGGQFFDHPPLAFWIEALAFKLSGASAATAVWLALLHENASSC